MTDVATKADGVAVSTAALAYFKLIPWPELAAFAAFVYTMLRIVQLVSGWVRKRKRA